MAVKTMTRFVIETKYPFPIDMLRYDRCYPADSETANAIEDSLINQGTKTKRRFVMLSEERFAPTEARWASYMAPVVEVEEAR